MTHYDTQPARFETIRSMGIMTTVVRLSIKEMEDGFDCDEVYYNHHEALTREKDYGGLISAIVRHRYSSDAMEAIINNYLHTKTTEHNKEFTEMQAWRKTAKEWADEILNTDETE